MKPIRWGCAVAFSLLAGCPAPSTDDDAGFDAAAALDGSRGDGGADTTRDAAMRDAAVYDAFAIDAFAIDAAASDAGADAWANDAGSDASMADAGIDAPIAVDANRDGGPESHPVVEEFFAALATEACDLYDRCGLDVSEELAFFSAGSCDELFGAVYADEIAPSLRALIAAGTVGYDSVAAQACLDRLPTAACTEAGAVMGDCVTAFHGLLADGATCGVDVECAVTSYCTDAFGCGNVGVCVPRLALGASCTTDSMCSADAYCGGVCRDYAEVGGACSSTLRCRTGLECWSGTCGDPLSIPPAAVGGACALEAGMRCMSGLVCADDTSTCQPGGVALGAACHPATPDPCIISAYCGAGNVCRMRAAPGESCASARCMANSSCGAGLVCVAISRVGGPCADAAYCRSDVCTGMVCQPGAFCD